MKDCVNTVAVTQSLGVGTPHCLTQIYHLRLQLKIGDELPSNCFNYLSYNRCILKKKVYCTASYSSGFKRDNSIVHLKTGEIVRIEKIVEIKKNCECPVDQKENACQLSLEELLGQQNHGIVMFGSKLKVKSVAPCIDKFANKIDLVGFMKEIDFNYSLGNVVRQRRRLMCFFPIDIAFKCLIVNDRTGRKFCIVNDIVFEGS